MHDKEEYVIFVRNLKQALNHRLSIKKPHRFIKFNEKAWLKMIAHMIAHINDVLDNEMWVFKEWVKLYIYINIYIYIYIYIYI